MKTPLIVLATFFLLAGVARAQWNFCETPNMIGLYNTLTPAGDPYETCFASPGSVYSHQTYLMICNPIDEATGLPIANIGGYELAIFSSTPGWSLDVTLPENTILFSQGLPNLRVSGLLPVTGDYTLLAEILISSWGDGFSMGGVRLAPIDDGAQTIPGHMAITNADNEFIPSRATNLWDDCAYEVYWINLGGCIPTPNEETTWSAIKATFR